MKVEILSCPRNASSYVGDIFKLAMPRPGTYFPEPEFTSEFIALAKADENTAVKFTTDLYLQHMQLPEYTEYTDIPWYRIGVVRNNLFEQSLSYLVHRIKKGNDAKPLHVKPNDVIKAGFAMVEIYERFKPLARDCDEVKLFENFNGDFWHDVRTFPLLKDSEILDQIDPHFDIDPIYNSLAPPKYEVVLNFEELRKLFEQEFTTIQKRHTEWLSDEYGFE